MLLTIHNLPLNMRYGDIKDLLKDKCGLTDLILDKLTKDGDSKKVTVGVADDGDAAILVRKINGLYLGNLQLYVEDARKKPDSEQPFRTSSMMNTGNFLQPPQVRMPANNIQQQQQQTPYAEDIQTRFSSESQQRYPNNNQSNQKRFPNDNNYNQTHYNSDQKSGGSNFQNNYAATSATNMPMAAAAMYPAADQMSQLQGTAAMYAMQQQQMMANYQMMGYYMPQVPDQNYSAYAAGNQAVATNMPQDIPQNTDWPVQPSGNDWEEPPMETEPEYRGRNQSDRRPRPRRSRSPLQPQNDRFDFGNRYEPANDRGRDDRPVESGRPSRFHDKDADFGNAGGFDRNGRRDRSPPRKMSRFDRDNKTDFLLPPGHNSGPRPAFGGRNHRDEPPAQRGLGQEESFGPRGSRPSRFERSDDRAPKRRYDETRSGPRFDETRSGPRFDETRSGPRFDESRSGPRFDETRSGPRFDEARSGPRFDETRSGPRFDEARSGPRFDAPTREPYPKAFPEGRADRPDRNFTQKERGFKQTMPDRFEDSRGPRDPMSNPRPTVQLTPEQLAIKQQNRLNTYRGMATATILKEVLQGRRPLEVPEQRALKQAIRAKVDGINVPRKTPVPILKEEIIRLYRQRYSTAGDTKFFHAVMRDFKKDLESSLAEGEPVHDKSIEKPTGNGTRPPRQESRPEPNSIIKQKPVKGGKAKPSKSMKSVFKSSPDQDAKAMAVDQPALEETSRMTSKKTENEIPILNVECSWQYFDSKVKRSENDRAKPILCSNIPSDSKMANSLAGLSDDAAKTRIENSTDKAETTILKPDSKEATDAAIPRDCSWGLETTHKRLTPRGCRGKRKKKNPASKSGLTVEQTTLESDLEAILAGGYTFSYDDVKDVPYQLSIAVIVAPRREMTETQANDIKLALQRKVFEQVDTEDEGFVPLFRGIPQYSEGALKLWCVDYETLSWITEIIETVPSPIQGTRLNIVQQKDLLVKVGILVPDFSESNRLILQYFTRQNACYDIGSWKIWSREKHGNNTFLTLGIPKSELPKIMERERRIDFLLGSIYVRFFDKNGVLSRNIPEDVCWETTEAEKSVSIEECGSSEETDERTVAQKQLQKLEYSGQTVYTLEPHLEKALEEEIDILGEVVKENCEAPQDEADTVVYNHINDVALDDFKQTLSIDVKKRILNIKSGLTLRVFFNPRPPKRPVFDEHMKKYGVVSVKKSERGKFWLIALNSYANYDKLFALQTTTIEGSTVNFKPLHVGGPPPKLTRDQFKQIKKARVASKIHDYDEEKFVVLDQDFSTDVIESEEPVKTPTRAKEITQKSGVLNENDLNDLLNVNEEDLVDY
ncbi:uncharacterized protein LOC105395455 isoform X2 [Plutella xylostella]|uniref:uncharacterized protein LOC105395455 isoform X2 n=1 Tax=Plutella xylostella TaxID=51655 RepID=UPI002032B1C0|nr:uncharacterized protein LOC105395455 isoform X2 [Plutella xylostella]